MLINSCKNKIYLLSNSFGKKIGLNLPYFIRSGFWVGSRHIIVGLSGLAISIGFARLSTKEILGQYQFVLSLLSFLSILSLPGLNISALRASIRGEDDPVIKTAKYSFIFSLLAIPIIIFYGVYNINSGRMDIGKALVLSAIIFPFFYAFNNWYVFYEGKTNFKSSSIRIITSNLVVALCMLAALYYKTGTLWLVVIFLGLNAFFNGVYFIQIFRKIKTKYINANLDFWYGMRFTFQKFTYSLSESLPPLIISFVFGFENLAIYQISYFSISIVLGVISALSATYLPLLFKYKKINYKKIVIKNLVIGVVLFIGFIIFIKLLFFTFYGEGYYKSYILAWIFSFSIIFLPLRVFLFTFFAVHDKNGWIIFSNLAGNAIALGCFYLLKNTSFLFSASVYFYFANLLVIIPLLFGYFRIASEKTDSMQLEASL